MSVLSACQSAMVRLVGRKPQTVFSSTSQMELEIADLATDVAVDIMKSHDWRALTKFSTLTGDGSTTAFDLPSDFDRIVLAQRVTDTSNWLWGYASVQTLEDWMVITSSGFTAVTPGWWIILDGQMQFSPAPASSSPAKFAYISKNIGLSGSDGSPIAAFSDDSDSFVLEERLLTLGLIWRWKAQKGLEYAEDMTNYEKAFSENASRDKGPQAIRKGFPSTYLGTHAAWPWQLG
jgi:hypothetical protein